MSSTPWITASNYKKFNRNTLQGFVDLTLNGSGIKIKECSHHLSHDREWISFPGKAMIDKDGRVMIDSAKGKPRYANIIEFADRAKGDDFQRIAIAAIHRLIDSSTSSTGAGDDQAA